MIINKMQVFGSRADKNMDGINAEEGFPLAEKPARQWFNQLFYDITSKNNEIIDLSNNMFTQISKTGVEFEQLKRDVNAKIQGHDATIQDIQNAVGSITGGKYAYKTYDEMLADAENITANSSIDVLADTDDTKNGTYIYDGADFIKSQYDISEIIKSEVMAVYATYAQLVSSDALNGSFAYVPDDNGGMYYEKVSGSWVAKGQDTMAVLAEVNEKLRAVPIVNSFPNRDFSGALRASHRVEYEDDVPIAVIDSNTQEYSVFEYPVGEDGLLDHGEDFYISVSAFTDSVDPDGCDLTVRYYGDGGMLSQDVISASVANEWQTLSSRSVVPQAATKVWIRLTKRYSPTFAKFKNIMLVTQKGTNSIDVVSMRDSIAKLERAVPVANLHPNIALTSSGSSRYDGKPAVEDGVPALDLSGEGVLAVFYDVDLTGGYTPAGVFIDISVDAWCDVSEGADLSAYIYDSNNQSLLYLGTAKVTVPNTWERLTYDSVQVPEGATHMVYRLISRSSATVAKFKNPAIMSSTISTSVIYPNASDSSDAVPDTVHVSKRGSDYGDGTAVFPYATITKALQSIGQSGVIAVEGGEYRESITIDQAGHVTIVASRNEAVDILGSDKLNFSPVPDLTDVYQAPLPTEPIGMGGVKGKPMIADWGTPSKPIPDEERHPLHHGRTHRLPYTPLYSAESKLAMTSTDNTWWWENGTIFLKVPSGTNMSSKRYEARVRSVLSHTGGRLTLVRVNSWLSNSYGMYFGGVSVERHNCKAFGSVHNGFADNGNVCESYQDEAADCGNDGFNGSISGSPYGGNMNNGMCQITYFDPYGHDNWDDGFSCHTWVDSTVHGGLFEYNTKADVIHVSGSNCICYNTEVRGTDLGFSSRGESSETVGRASTMLKCVGTIATGNRVAYNGGTGGLLLCDNTSAIEPTSSAYDGNVIAVDAKYTITGPADIKTGNVIVKNTSALT